MVREGKLCIPCRFVAKQVSDDDAKEKLIEEGASGETI